MNATTAPTPRWVIAPGLGPCKVLRVAGDKLIVQARTTHAVAKVPFSSVQVVRGWVGGTVPLVDRRP